MMLNLVIGLLMAVYGNPITAQAIERNSKEFPLTQYVREFGIIKF